MARRRLAALVVAVVALVGPAAGAEPPPSQHDPATVRELADEILARDEFRPPEPTLLERLGDWLEDLLPGDSEGGGSGSESGTATAAAGTGGSSVLTVILLVLAAVVVGYVVFALVRQPRRRRPEDDDDPELEVEPHRTAREWAAAAERFEAEGRWKDGIRCRFRALVEQLVDERIVPEVAGRTSGELRSDVVANLPAAAGPFGWAAELFDRAWYGDLPTGPEEAAQFATSAASVLAEVPRRPAVAEPVEVDA